MKTHAANHRHGGVRVGAGRKPAYGEPTRTVRVPESHLPVVLEYLDALKHGQQGASPLEFPSAAGADNRVRLVSASRRHWVVPLLGREVRAGNPSGGDDFIEGTVDLGSHLVRDPQSTFVMKIKGWSMRDAGIGDGDEIVVDVDVAAENGRIVVAEVDGELTVKRLRLTDTGCLLQAANSNFADVNVSHESELRIWGVVTHVLRKV